MNGRSIFKVWFSLVFITALALAGCSGGGGGTPAANDAGGDSVNSYTVGGSVTGLSGAVLLQNSGGDDLSVSSDGSFTFATPVNAGAAYAVTILIQPEGQTCTVSESTGVIASGNISNVVVTCAATAIGTQMGGARQGVPLNLATAVTTLAGAVGRGSTDATGAAALFNYPDGVTSDGTHLFVADRQNHTIRKIVIATGVVTTLAGVAGESGATDGTGTAARFSWPQGITHDDANLYVADSENYTVRKVVIATGVVTTLAGKAGWYGADDGAGTAARFSNPSGITSDGVNLYVADRESHTIRKIVIATGVVTTLAGAAREFGATDATGTAARFYYPSGITSDGTHLYVTDSKNYTIRKIVIATGVVTTLAGTAGTSGSTDATGTAARFSWPQGITRDDANLYVADSQNHTVRKVVIATGVVTTLAGSARTSGSADATGTAARFESPVGITTDDTYLYVVDSNNHTIRRIVIATGVVTTLAGTAGRGSADGMGAAARFDFDETAGITTDGTYLYVADYRNHTIRKIVIATGVVTTLAGTAGEYGSADGVGAAARFNYPYGITTDGTHLYVADTYNSTIRKIEIATGVVTTLAGTAGEYSSADGVGAAARFSDPQGITTDGAHLYVADSSNSTIRKVVIATGVVTTLAGTVGLSGSTDGTGAAARFYYPYGITTDGTHLYVADSENNTIRKVVIATGEVTTLVGTAGEYGSTDGTGAAARFRYPQGITSDGTHLYVADSSNGTIRKIVIATGVVTTLAGTTQVYGSTDAVGVAARFNQPYGITTDGIDLYVTDSENNTIRRIQ